LTCEIEGRVKFPLEIDVLTSQELLILVIDCDLCFIHVKAMTLHPLNCQPFSPFLLRFFLALPDRFPTKSSHFCAY
jgi:hypothetical protein